MFRNARTRLILITVLISALSTALVLGVLYISANQIIERETRRVVNAEIIGLSEEYSRAGVLGLAGAIERREQRLPDRAAVYLLTDNFGNKIAGNLGAWPPTVEAGGGWIEIDLIRTDTGRSVPIAAASLRLPGGERLLVGRDATGQTRFDRALWDAALLAAGAALVLSLVSGWLLTRLVFSRVGEVADTARTIVSGDLTRRIPLRGTDDEFDQLAGTLNNMLGRIEMLVTSLRTATDSLAHDLRSPLTRLGEHLHQLEDGTLPEDARAAAAQRAEAEVTHILRILTDMTEISRAEAGIGRAEFDQVEIDELLRDAHDLYHPVAEDAGIALTVSGTASPITGHRALLSQVLSNLIENSLRFAPEGSEIALQVTDTDKHVSITVEDQGPGVPEADLRRIAEPFVTGDQSRTAAHSGLGLALASAVAGMHDGALTLENRLNGPGLRATVTLSRDG
ncbi:MAG: HAMP domain-containing protein [Rhodobacteraceae bacterium]|nr:HAMP domain-containing protein [Paracoccaceae bacterium]